MPLPSCLCVAGRPPFDQLGDIFCALSQVDLACVIPNFVSGEVNGSLMTLTFDQEVTGTGAGITVNFDSGSSTATYLGGDDTFTLAFTLANPVSEGELVFWDYDALVGDIQSGADCPLATLQSASLTNNTGVFFYYLRPDGVSRYLRPDGVSYYLRP